MNKSKIGLLIFGMVAVLGLIGCATGRQVKGYVTGVSVANRTLTINGEVIHVPKNIRMVKAGTPIALQDVVIGYRVDARIKEGSNPPEATSFTVLSTGGKESRK